MEVLDAVAKRLAPKFVFGYHSLEDIEQQARLIALEAVPRYDGKRNFYNFIFTHTKNRLCTYKRDNYERLNTPCEKCPFNAWIKETDECTKYENKFDCELYHKWLMRNSAKKNLMRPIGITCATGKNEEFMEIPNSIDNSVTKKEIVDIIESKLTSKQRKYWLKLKTGQKLKKAELEEVKSALSYITGDYSGEE